MPTFQTPLQKLICVRNPASQRRYYVVKSDQRAQGPCGETTLSGLDSINVLVEGTTESGAMALNALPLLHEIRHALETLATDGESTTIDLSAPFAPGDRQQLLEVLGSGEVEATVNAMGPTRIRETGFPGVWLVQYLGTSDEEVATHIEITRCPSLLLTPETDIADSTAALAARLQG